MKTWQTLLLSTLALQAAAVARADLGLHAGAEFAFGPAKQPGSLDSRTLNTVALRAAPGYWLGPVLIGPAFEYIMTGQVTAPAEVGNTNAQGKGYYLGPALVLSLGPVHLAGGYDFFGKYSLARTTATGDEVSYSGLRAWHASFGFPIFQGLNAEARVRKSVFTKSRAGAVESSYDAASGFSMTSVGVELSFLF